MADVFTLDSAYLEKLRTQIMNGIAYARYKVGNNWYQSRIEDARAISGGRIEVTFLIDHTVSGNITVTNIELYDHNGARVGSKAVNITRADVTEGILYVCRFSLFQVVENSRTAGKYDAL